MPIYVYQCETCGVTFERRQRMSETPLKDCPECGGDVHRVIQPVGVVFKGSGFYVTDHRSPSSTALPGTKKSEGDKEPESKSEPESKGSLESKSGSETKSAGSSSKAEKKETASSTSD